jgi:LptD protein
VESGRVVDTRIFAATYQSAIDWNPDFKLPGFWQNKFNITPSVSLANVDPGPYWVASERTNGVYVHQGKRITGGIGMAPTIFGLFPGFGPFQRIRHSLTPTMSWTWGPRADVSDQYLAALGRTRAGGFTNLPLNNVSFGLTQLFQAKLRSRNDSNPDGGQKIDLLAISMTPLNYDFARAQGHARTAGFTTDSWGYSLRSDLLPGFDFSSQYSLFLGSTLSDTAEFKPYLTSISASFTLSREQNPLTVFRKLFGAPAPAPTPPTDSAKKAQAAAGNARIQAENAAAQPVAGTVRGPDRFIQQNPGWRARFDLTRSSPRPPKPGANVIDFDPRARCAQIAGDNSALFNACVNAQQAQPTTDTPVVSATAGGPAYNIPPTTNLTSDIAFNLTPKWGTHWITSYDLEHHAFASQNVQLQRDLHDWQALFGYTQSPNGNFAFTFTIRLKADADVKFDYNRATVRSGTF